MEYYSTKPQKYFLFSQRIAVRNLSKISGTSVRRNVLKGEINSLSVEREHNEETSIMCLSVPAF